MSPELTYNEKAVMALLESAADAGVACPSNTAIGNRLGMSGGSEILSSLERKGLIKVERGSSKRVVTILATGKRTAGEITSLHWRLRPENQGKLKARAGERCEKKRPPERLVEDLPRVEQASCFWCGTRFEGQRCGNCKRAVR